jgi:hypothetical protein
MLIRPMSDPVVFHIGPVAIYRVLFTDFREMQP